MAIGGVNVGQELLNVPMGSMIRSMAMAIADAQWALDKSSMRMAEMMSGNAVLRDRQTDRPLLTTDGHLVREDTRVDFGYVYSIPADGSEPKRESLRVSMMELGFTPNFYQFVDTIIEVKISISITGSEQKSNTESRSDKIETDSNGYVSRHSDSHGGRYWGGWWNNSSHSHTNTESTRVQTSQVNASYASKFGYSAEGASLLRTKLVPVPPPAILEERIHEVIKLERDYNRWKMLESLRDDLEKDKDGAGLSPEQVKELDSRITGVDEEIKDLIRNFAKA